MSVVLMLPVPICPKDADEFRTYLLERIASSIGVSYEQLSQEWVSPKYSAAREYFARQQQRDDGE